MLLFCPNSANQILAKNIQWVNQGCQVHLVYQSMGNSRTGLVTAARATGLDVYLAVIVQQNFLSSIFIFDGHKKQISPLLEWSMFKAFLKVYVSSAVSIERANLHLVPCPPALQPTPPRSQLGSYLTRCPPISWH